MEVVDPVFQRSSSNNSSLKIFFLIFLLCLSVAGALFSFWYTYIFLAPENIAGRMFAKMFSTNTFFYGGNVNSSFEGDFDKTSPLLPNKYSLTLSFSGDSDITDKKFPKISSEVNLVAQNLFAASFEFRLIKNKLYLLIKELPDLSLFKENSPVMDWMVTDTHNFGDFDFGTIAQLNAGKVFRLGKKLSSENINMSKTFHFQFDIDKKELFSELENILKTKKNYTGGDIKTLNKLKERISFNSGEIWIDKKTYNLRKITFSFGLSGEAENQKINVDSQMVFNGYGAPVNVQEPLNARPLEETVAGMKK